jgi:shikimate kinase
MSQNMSTTAPAAPASSSIANTIKMNFPMPSYSCLMLICAHVGISAVYRRAMSVSTSVPPFRVPKTVALVGLMGTGKTAVGKRLAQRLGLPFVDADAAIEAAAGNVTVEEIFERHGEAFFRAREREVIKRLLKDPVCVLAAGGGAYLDTETRGLIRERAISIWLKADIALMMSRVARRNNRPLLKGKDPRAVFEEQIAERYPIYAQADIAVESVDGPPEKSLDRVQAALAKFLGVTAGAAS